MADLRNTTYWPTRTNLSTATMASNPSAVFCSALLKPDLYFGIVACLSEQVNSTNGDHFMIFMDCKHSNIENPFKTYYVKPPDPSRSHPNTTFGSFQFQAPIEAAGLLKAPEAPGRGQLYLDHPLPKKRFQVMSVPISVSVGSFLGSVCGCVASGWKCFCSPSLIFFCLAANQGKFSEETLGTYMYMLHKGLSMS